MQDDDDVAEMREEDENNFFSYKVGSTVPNLLYLKYNNKNKSLTPLVENFSLPLKLINSVREP